MSLCVSSQIFLPSIRWKCSTDVGGSPLATSEDVGEPEDMLDSKQPPWNRPPTQVIGDRFELQEYMESY